MDNEKTQPIHQFQKRFQTINGENGFNKERCLPFTEATLKTDQLIFHKTTKSWRQINSLDISQLQFEFGWRKWAFSNRIEFCLRLLLLLLLLIHTCTISFFFAFYLLFSLVSILKDLPLVAFHALNSFPYWESVSVLKIVWKNVFMTFGGQSVYCRQGRKIYFRNAFHLK